jgi:hypothetical protein
MKIFALIAAAALILFSCNAIKESRDRKAIGRVLSSPSLTDRVYNVAVGLHPVLPNNIYVPGKDTTIYDSIAYPIYVDSIIIKDCPKLNLDSLKKLFTKTIRITNIRVDTIKKEDVELKRLWASERDQRLYAQGQLLAVQGQLTDANKTIKEKNFTIILTDVIGAIIIGFLVIMLFKKR